LWTGCFHCRRKPDHGDSSQHRDHAQRECAAACRRGGGLMYVAVKGGEKAIANAHRWMADRRRANRQQEELGTAQVEEQLGLAVDRVMAEASLYDPELAALAFKQASGDLVEAVFL